MPTPVELAAEALADPTSAVLVGAGASAAAELPTWTGLLETIASSLAPAVAETVRMFARSEQYLEAAEVARLAVKDDVTWNGFFEAFVTAGKTTSAWNLTCSLGLAKIVTTNWDNVGEHSFASVWNRAASEHVGVDELLTPIATLHPHIVHAHGKAPRWNTIVFTNSQYRDAERNPKYRDFWIDVLVKRPLLVVGFSGADPAFKRIRAIIADLGIAHLVAPFVIHGASKPIADLFGPKAVSLPYGDSGGHDELATLLRELREALNAARARKNLPENPYERAGVPATYLAAKDDLLLALTGVDFRSVCDSESLIALTALLRHLRADGTSSLDAVADATVSNMRVSRAEALEAASSAVRVARGRGWITGEDDNLKPSSLVPTPSQDSLNELLSHIDREAQWPVTWTGRDQTVRFTKDAVLAYLGATGGRAARSLMGLEVGRFSDADHLRRAVVSAGGGVGSAAVEKQICAAVIEVMDAPPERLAPVCGRLSNFALVTQLASVSTGRDLLRAFTIEKLYLDSNIFLPAIAPGHPWHSRCASLLGRAERHVRNVVILDGFHEEARIQYSEARQLAARVRDTNEFLRIALARAQPNVFLDGFAGWASTQPPTPSFQDYCAHAGLGADVLERVKGNWSNVSVVKAPRSFGKFQELHARVQYRLSDATRHGRLVEHEADQLALLALELEGAQTLSTRFVTAHARLREFVAREHLRIAPAVVPPVALAHLLAVTHPTEIPPASLREFAFSGDGLEVTETVFAVLIERWKGDATKLRALVTEQVAEKLRSALISAANKDGFFEAIDSRQRLIEVVMRDIVPEVEEAVATAGTSRIVARPPLASEGANAATRLAVEVLGDFRLKKPRGGE